MALIIIGVAKLQAEFDDLIDGFDFDLPASVGSLGYVLAVRTAQMMSERSYLDLDVNGQPFAPNEAHYAEYKLDRYWVDRPGELGGQMLSVTSMLGQPLVSSYVVVMNYGLNIPPPSVSRLIGMPLKPHETYLTDVEKAELFALGEFYGFDDGIETEVARITENRLEKLAIDKGWT